MILEKAHFFAQKLYIKRTERFKITMGWVAAFKNRYGASLRELYEESGSAVISEDAEEQIAIIKQKIHQYERKNVYNMNETGLFYCIALDKTIAT